MIVLKSVTVRGTSAGGDFAGTCAFADGVQVIHGENGFGKSIIASAVAWCLGLEPMYGVRAGDNSLFSDGPRDKVNLSSGQDLPVGSAYADLTLQLGTKFVKVTRPITGSETNLASIVDVDKDGKTVGSVTRLFYGRGTMADATGGFHAHFFEWAGLPQKQIVNFQGRETQIYFENIGPLFFIEQLGGWRDLQAEQVYRYNLVGIKEAVVEYLLGLDARLEARFRKQVATSREDELRQQAVILIDEINAFVRRNQWTKTVSSHGGLSELKQRISQFRLSRYLAEEFSWEFTKESAQLQRQLEALQKTINATDVNAPELKSAAPQAEVGRRVIELKENLQRKKEELSVLRNQLTSQESLLMTVETRKKSAGDLLRLKASNIGTVETAECPTCHHVIEPKDFDLSLQSKESIERYIEVLEREREALHKNIASQRAEIDLAIEGINQAEKDYAVSQQRLAVISNVVDRSRETLVAISLKILDVEKNIERNQENKRDVDRLEMALDDWRTRVEKIYDTSAGAVSPDEIQKISDFETKLSEFLFDLRHSALGETALKVAVDDDYVPTLRGRPLRLLGAASDRARLITAYVLALLDTALRKKGHHPGFVLLDEPLQQNPDEKRHDRFAQFLSKRWKEIKGQVIILTSLKTEDIATLKTAGVPLKMLPIGTHFLEKV